MTPMTAAMAMAPGLRRAQKQQKETRGLHILPGEVRWSGDRRNEEELGY